MKVLPCRAPPHTRGSTGRSLSRPGRPGGSPAHAGIDPPRTPAAAPAARLPRTRGDRPPWKVRLDDAEGAPPHTRGSTRTGRLSTHPGHGSPAHAGIDPLMRVGYQALKGLPRTRGDRPLPWDPAEIASGAPPHTRGSTLCVAHHYDVFLGSPAHAGIDPPPTCLAATSPGLPRTRGDRPQIVQPEAFRLTAPPHTRGSTRLDGG